MLTYSQFANAKAENNQRITTLVDKHIYLTSVLKEIEQAGGINKTVIASILNAAPDSFDVNKHPLNGFTAVNSKINYHEVIVSLSEYLKALHRSVYECLSDNLNLFFQYVSLGIEVYKDKRTSISNHISEMEEYSYMISGLFNRDESSLSSTIARASGMLKATATTKLPVELKTKFALNAITHSESYRQIANNLEAFPTVVDCLMAALRSLSDAELRQSALAGDRNELTAIHDVAMLGGLLGSPSYLSCDYIEDILFTAKVDLDSQADMSDESIKGSLASSDLYRSPLGDIQSYKSKFDTCKVLMDTNVTNVPFSDLVALTHLIGGYTTLLAGSIKLGCLQLDVCEAYRDFGLAVTKAAYSEIRKEKQLNESGV